MSRSTDPGRSSKADVSRLTAAGSSSSKSRAALMSSSESGSSSSSDDEDEATSRGVKTSTTTSGAGKPARLISSSSDSDESSDDDSMTLAVRNTADKSRRGVAPTATSTPLPARHSIYTSSDNDDDDDDGTDSDSVRGKQLKSPVAASSASKPSQAKKPQSTAQSSSKKLDRASTGSKLSTAARDSSMDSDAVQTSGSRASSVQHDTKKQRNKLHTDSSVLGSSGSKKDVSKKLVANVSGKSDKPVSHHHVSSSSVFGDALAKSAAVASHAKLGLKSGKDVKKDASSASSRTTGGTHKNTSSDHARQKSSAYADMSSVRSKHSISESSRHAMAKSSTSGGSVEKLGGQQQSGHRDAGHDSVDWRRLEESSVEKSKRTKHSGWTGDRVGTDSDESPLIRPGNIFEKMGEKQDTSGAEKVDDESQLFGAADSAVAAEEIAVFMAESDDDERDHISEPAASKLSIERLKEDSAKEETIDAAVKAIIEFTKEPSTPPMSSSKATDSSELQEDTSHDGDDDDDIGQSDELNAAIGNLIEKELEPGSELGGQSGSKTVAADSSDLSSASTHYRPSTSTHTMESAFVSSSGSSLKDGHMPTTPAAHDEQNVTSFMSRLQKATADVVDFAAISAAAAASRKLPADKLSTDLTATSKPAEPGSRLFASPPQPAVKTEDEKLTSVTVVKKEDNSVQDEETGKLEPPEFPLSTRIYATSTSSSTVKQEVHGVSAGVLEKPVPSAAPVGDAGIAEDCSSSADLYEFKDSDDDDVKTTTPRQKDFVLHKRSRKRHADSESNDADVVDLKKLRTIYVKSEQQQQQQQQHETAASTQPGHPSAVADTQNQCAAAVPQPTDSQLPVSSSASSSSVQSSWRSNMDMVIDAVARGEFERGDDFNFYTTQTPAAPRGTPNTNQYPF